MRTGRRLRFRDADETERGFVALGTPIRPLLYVAVNTVVRGMAAELRHSAASFLLELPPATELGEGPLPELHAGRLPERPAVDCYWLDADGLGIRRVKNYSLARCCVVMSHSCPL